MKSLLQKLLFFILLLLPVLDKIYEYDNSSPAVMVRAGAIVIMALLLVEQITIHSTKPNSIIYHVFTLIAFTLITTVLNEKGFSSIFSIIKISFPFIGFSIIYYLTRNSALDEKYFKILIFSLIVIYGVISYLNLGHRLDLSRGLSVADNTGYSLVTLLPGVMLFTNKKWTFLVSLFIIIVGALFCGKRGAIVAMAIAILPIVKYYLNYYSRSSAKEVIMIIIVIIASYVALYFFGDFFNESMSRFESIEEDGGSGRTDIYRLYLDHFAQSDFIHQIFGHGLFAGQWGKAHEYAFISIVAHNEWLEILFDFGILGILFYIFIFRDLIVQLWKNRRNKDIMYYMLLVSLLVFGIKSVLSSTFLMSANSIYMFMLMAYAMAKLDIRQKCLSKRVAQKIDKLN